MLDLKAQKSETYEIRLRPGNEELLGLDWERSITEWDPNLLVDLPRGISRHTVRFVSVGQGTFAVKELPRRSAQRDYEGLGRLESLGGPSVRPVGMIVRNQEDPGSELAAALVTRYVDYSFSYRELVTEGSFGARRSQLLDAFAMLLVQIHLLGCFWGDCSLSNVLYRYDAGALETTLVDAETASIYPRLSDGQRQHDLEIMIENVAGEMADIAASHGLSLDQADLTMGEDIAARYHPLWNELNTEVSIPADQQFRVTEHIRRLNDLGFEVKELDVVPHKNADHIHVKVQVADRQYHSNRLRELTGIDAGELQARQILADLAYYSMKKGSPATDSGRALTAMRWRVEAFEPVLKQIRKHLDPDKDPVQGYCDLLHHRYMRSVEAGRDVGTTAALEDWLAVGQPGYPI